MANPPKNIDELNEILRGILGPDRLDAIQGEVKAILGGVEHRKQVELRRQQMLGEDEASEQANWFGKTGLPDTLERELPRYLRRELGESLFDKGSLQAADLTYLGSHAEEDGVVHYWAIPSRSKRGTYSYAYIQIAPDGSSCTGWDDREPPKAMRDKLRPASGRRR